MPEMKNEYCDLTGSRKNQPTSNWNLEYLKVSFLNITALETEYWNKFASKPDLQTTTSLSIKSCFQK